MNRIDMQQAGGFPLETDTIDFLQKSFTALQSLAALGGDNLILSGCIVAGANVSDGWVVINEEVLPFKGGALQAKVVIRESITNKNFENGTNKPVYFERWAQFGTGETFVLFNDLVRIKDLKTFRNLPHEASSAIDSNSETSLATSKAIKDVFDALKNQVPAGIIVMWSGLLSNIPAGWALHEPSRDKFIVGAGNLYPIGSVGGNRTITLSSGQLPPIIVKAWVGNRTKDESGGAQTLSVGPVFTNGQSTLLSVGNGESINIMNPYYALAYIIKL